MAYEKTTWVDGMVISAEAMNNIENGIATLDENGVGLFIVDVIEEEVEDPEPSPGLVQ